MLNGVRRHVNSADVITVNKGGATQRNVQLNKELAQPRDLGNDIGNRPILGLGTRARDCILTLG